MTTTKKTGRRAENGVIRVGIGGWTFEPWRGVFFPAGLSHAKELDHASRQLTTIEINGTFYRTQSPATFRKWSDAVPDDFVFSVKALQYTTHKKVLAEAGESVSKFLKSGLTELGPKLGPILWQFARTKRFDPEDFGAFLKLLPARQDGVRLRHAVEVRHESFCDPAFVALARANRVAIVYTDDAEFPVIADVTADFVYARLQCTKEKVKTGYTGRELDRWAGIAQAWVAGTPTELPRFGTSAEKVEARDVFLYMIAGAKVRAPAAATALLTRLRKSASAKKRPETPAS